MSIVFATERLVIRPWSYDDVDAAYAMYSRPEFVHYLGNPVPHESVAFTRGWVGRVLENNAKAAPGHGFWAVQDDGLVGAAICQPLPGDDRVEIGWHVAPELQGRGYATEFGRGLVAHAGRLGHEEVYAVVNPANTPSLRVAAKLGMQPLGRTDRYYDTELVLFVCPTRSDQHTNSPLA